MRTLKLMVAVASAAFVLLSVAPAASAGTMTVTCTRTDGKVVLKIRANDHAAHGLHRAMEASAMAQQRLGVTCSDMTGEAVSTVHHRVVLSCTNGSGDPVFKLSANENAFKGLGVAVQAFGRHAAARLGVSCDLAQA
jgi:hypothetical protein